MSHQPTLPDNAIYARPELRQHLAKALAAQEARNVADLCLDTDENPFLRAAAVSPKADPPIERLLAQQRHTDEECVVLANDVREALARLLQLSCSPRQDAVVTVAPSLLPVAELCWLHGVDVVTLPLGHGFSLDAPRLLAAMPKRARIVVLSNPNNPTGNLLDSRQLLTLTTRFQGLVVVDETYLDFAREPSLAAATARCPRLVVVRSLAPAWASSELRLAAIYAHPEVAALLRALWPAHDVGAAVREQARQALRRGPEADRWMAQLADERRRVMAAFSQLPTCQEVFPSAANFFMARMHSAEQVRQLLAENGVHVFSCTSLPQCADCLRFTIGLSHENSRLLSVLRSIPASK